MTANARVSNSIFSESTEFEGDLVSPTVAPSGETQIPVAIVTQSSLDVLLTGPTGTATTTIEITTPSLEELAIEPMERDLIDETEAPFPSTTETPTDEYDTEGGPEYADNRFDIGTIRPESILDDDPEARNVTEMTESFMTEVMGMDFAEKSCTANVCRNGGTCLSTLTGPKCHCPLQFSGRQCEEEVTVDVPGFVGHSLLVHSIPNDTSGINIMLTFRTSTPNGLLFYTGSKDQMMIAAYLQNGILKFKVINALSHNVIATVNGE